MKGPISVRSFSDRERETLKAGLRSKDTFTLRRSQMLLASSRGDDVSQISTNLGCGQQTVRDTIHDFNARGVNDLVAKSSRPRRTRDAFDERSAEALSEMLHRSPREFDRQSSLWTLERLQQRLPLRRGSPKGGSQGRPSGRRFRAFSETDGRERNAGSLLRTPCTKVKEATRPIDGGGRDQPRMGHRFPG
jgi:transposase